MASSLPGIIGTLSGRAMTGKLARIRWSLGQTLLPEHFAAQEEALLADSALRFRLAGLPAYGIAALEWGGNLGQGILALRTATIVLPSGRLLDVPGNAAAAPLNLNMPGAKAVTAYLHVLRTARGSDGEQWAEDSLPRVTVALALSADASHPDAEESFKIAEFKKSPQGEWSLSDRYVPPLLMVGASPFLRAELESLATALEGFQDALVMDSTNYLSGAGLHSVRRCLRELYRVRRMLAGCQANVHLHPYHLYEALKDLYLEVAFYRDSPPKHAAEPYNHDQIAVGFQRVLGPLMDQMQLASARSPHLPFKLQDGVYRAELPADIKQAGKVYFLIQKDQIHRTVSLADFKLAGLSRLPLMHKLALGGVPLRKVDRPALAHYFGQEVEFHEITAGDDWQHAVQEGVVAFYNQPDFQALEFYLYWG